MGTLSTPTCCQQLDSFTLTADLINIPCIPNKHTLPTPTGCQHVPGYLINILCLPRHAANSLTADSLIAYSLTAYTLTAYLINIPCIPNKQTLPTPTCCQHVPGYLINIP